MRILTPSFLFFIVGVGASAQTHPFSNAWSYSTTAVTSSAQFTGTTIVSTGGTATHTINSVGVYLQSPSGRTSEAFDYPVNTSGQATAYLSLCGNGECEDGNFFASTNGTSELCGQTGTVMPVALQEKTTPVSPWARWMTATVTPVSIARVPQSNNEHKSTFVATMQKSTHCGGVTASISLARSPANLSLEYLPNFDEQAVAFILNGGTVSWVISTQSGNQHSGTVVVGAGAESFTNCTINGNLGISTVAPGHLTVQ